MSDASLNISSFKGNVSSFEANSAPLATKTLGLLNFDKSNDFSKPLQLKNADGSYGPNIYLRPDQIDAIRMQSLGGGRAAQLAEAMGEQSKAGITATVNGQTYKISNADIQALHGTL